MECLRDYIGLMGCGVAAPDSGLWINNLPGLTNLRMDNLADSDQVTYRNAWRDIQTTALRRFDTSITKYFREKYQLRRLFDRYQLGRLFNANETIAADANEWRGFSITLDPYITSSLAEVSQLMMLSVTNLQYYATAAGDVDFRIVNSESEEVIWSETVTLSIGWNTVLKDFRTPVLDCPRKMNVQVKATQTTIESELGQNTGSGGGCSCSCSIGDCSAIMQGEIFDTISGETTVTQENAHGFRGYVSLLCSYEGLVCANKSLFSSALWYLLGSEFTVAAKFTERINELNTVNDDDLKEMHDYFEKMYMEEMDGVVKGISLDGSDCCLVCQPPISDQTVIG